MIDPRLHQDNFVRSFSEDREIRGLEGPPAGNGFYARGGAKIERVAPIVRYRFHGDGGGQDWCISDMTAAWPLMDELRELVAEYERITQHAKARMLRRRIADKAVHINSIAMKLVPVHTEFVTAG